MFLADTEIPPRERRRSSPAVSSTRASGSETLPNVMAPSSNSGVPSQVPRGDSAERLSSGRGGQQRRRPAGGKQSGALPLIDFDKAAAERALGVAPRAGRQQAAREWHSSGFPLLCCSHTERTSSSSRPVQSMLLAMATRGRAQKHALLVWSRCSLHPGITEEDPSRANCTVRVCARVCVLPGPSGRPSWLRSSPLPPRKLLSAAPNELASPKKTTGHRRSLASRTADNAFMPVIQSWDQEESSFIAPSVPPIPP
ncbi:hypothetical protein MRX96_030549 [Rhipicephalus microplus]